MFMKLKNVMAWICTTASLSCWICYTICHCFVEENMWPVRIWHARVMHRCVKIPPMPQELVYSHWRERMINLSLKKSLTQYIIPRSNRWHRNYLRKLKTLMNLFYTNPIKMQSSIMRTLNLPQANVSLFRIPNQGVNNCHCVPLNSTKAWAKLHKTAEEKTLSPKALWNRPVKAMETEVAEKLIWILGCQAFSTFDK